MFDSGLGGLTAVRELRRLLPGEDIVYFGDTGRVPYGGRSVQSIIKYARQDVAFLRQFDLKAIVVACGTVSTTALDVLEAENPIPVLGVVGPAAKAAARSTRNGRIGLIGTQASIRSGAYERQIAAENPGGPGAGPGLPPLCAPGGERTLPARGRGHRDGGGGVPGPPEGGGGGHPGAGVHPLPPAGAGHRRLHGPVGHPGERGCGERPGGGRHAGGAEGPGRPEREGQCRCYVSDQAEDFSRLASIFLGWDVEQAVEQVDISQY